jgi:4'-phosphopantetheinyl transferase EntD
MECALPPAVKLAFSQLPGGRGTPTDFEARHRRRSLAGRRLAAQAAVRLLGPADAGAPLQVRKDERGRPWLHVAGRGSDIDVSISHTGDCVVAAAVRGLRVGVDIEPLDALPDPRTWRYFLTPEEMRACAGHPRRALWSWMIKEAAYKAMDAREPIDFKAMVVRGWDEGREHVQVFGPFAQAPAVCLQEYRGCAIVVVLIAGPGVQA